MLKSFVHDTYDTKALSKLTGLILSALHQQNSYVKAEEGFYLSTSGAPNGKKKKKKTYSGAQVMST